MKKEALQFWAIMDKQVIKELERGNKYILRYVVNRIRRIWKVIDPIKLQRVIDGDSTAIEHFLWLLLLDNWEGPIVKFMDSDK